MTLRLSQGTLALILVLLAGGSTVVGDLLAAAAALVGLRLHLGPLYDPEGAR